MQEAALCTFGYTPMSASVSCTAHRLRAGDGGSMVRSDASMIVDRLLSKASRPRPMVTPSARSSTTDSILEPGSSHPQTGALSRR